MIAGDEVYASNAAPEALGLAETFGAPVYGSSWPLHIPFPTSHPLWAGNLPTKASEIAETLKLYDAVFALGGKSLITILYTEGSAVPPGCDVFQMSADVRDLGRTYATKLSVVGDIKASLDTLLPLLGQRLAGRAEAYAGLCAIARRNHMARRARLTAAADAAYDAPLIAPIVAARETVRAIGPQVAIIDEAPATMLHLRGFLDSASTRHTRSPAAGRSAGACRHLSATHSVLVGSRSSVSSATVLPCTRHKRSGRPRMKDCR